GLVYVYGGGGGGVWGVCVCVCVCVRPVARSAEEALDVTCATRHQACRAGPDWLPPKPICLLIISLAAGPEGDTIWSSCQCEQKSHTSLLVSVCVCVCVCAGPAIA